SFGGSWPFIFIFLAIIVGWVTVNTLLMGHLLYGKAFDPYPYIALNLLLSALARLPVPVIMMSLNRAEHRDEHLAQHHSMATKKSDELLQANTTLTQQVCDLTQQMLALTERLCNGSR